MLRPITCERKTMTLSFQDFGLSGALNTSLRKMDYKNPTPIQQQAIPLALQGKDLLASAQTGTGKTAAFSIPLVENILQSPTYNSALVLTPTRELAGQVLDVIHQLLGPKSGVNTAFIIGGDPYRKQFQQLERNPRIIVGTPGRINDHIERGSIDLSTTNFLVLDETDRMLDMGFGVQLDRIVKHLAPKRQTLMFSATLPKGIIAISDKYLKNPERVSVGEVNVIATNIKQEVIQIEPADKYQELQVQLNERQGSVIVFVKTKYNADRMAKKLREDGFTSEGLHGDLRQRKRDQVMQNFRSKNFRILIATDIAARGLDVPHIEHVINYDLPQVAEDYIHRMGRTARAGAQGSAISFVSNQDGRKWHAIERLLNPEAANDYKERPQGKNKARKKPYRGRPESKRTREDRVNENFEKYVTPREEKHAKKPAHKPKKFEKSNDGEGRAFETRKPKGKHASGEKFAKDRKEKFEKSNNGKGKSFETKKPKGKHVSGEKFVKDRKEKFENGNAEGSKKPKRSRSEDFKKSGGKAGGKKADARKPGGKKSGGFKSHKSNGNAAKPMKRRSKNKTASRKAA